MDRTLISVGVLLLCLLTGNGAAWEPPATVSLGWTCQRDMYDSLKPLEDFMRSTVNSTLTLLPDTTVRLQHMMIESVAYSVYERGLLLFNGNDSLPGKPQPDSTAKFPPPVAVVGPVYSHNAVVMASMGSALQVPVIGVRSDSPQLSDRIKYPYFLRTWPISVEMAKAVAAMMFQKGWTSIGFLYFDNEVMTAVTESVEEQLSNWVDGVHVERFPFVSSVPSDNERSNDPDNLTPGFEADIVSAVTAAKDSRANLIMYVSPYGSKRVWLEAHTQGLFPYKQLITHGDMIGANYLPDFSELFPPSAVVGGLVFSLPPPVEEWALGQAFRAYHQRSMLSIEVSMASAMMVVVRALDSLLYNRTANHTLDSIRGQTLLDELYATPLDDGWTHGGEAKFTDIGERTVDWSMLNIKAASDGSSVEYEEVGWWSHKASLNESLELYDHTDIIYHTGDTQTPIDWITVYKYNLIRVSEGVRMVIVALVALSMMLGLALLLFNVYNRERHIIRMSSAKFNSIMILGGMMLYGMLLSLIVDTSMMSEDTYVNYCYVNEWLFALGFTVFFGALFLKTCRVWLIFRSRDIGPIAVPDLNLFLGLLGLVLADVALLVAHATVSPWRYSASTPRVDIDEFSINHVYYWDGCASDHSGLFLMLLLASKMLLVSAGLFLSFQTRHVSIAVLNDSRLIAFSIYNVVILACFAVPLTFVLNSSSSTQAVRNGTVAVISGAVWLSVFTTMAMVFMPKVYHVIRGTEARITSVRSKRSRLSTRSRRTRATGSTQSTISSGMNTYVESQTQAQSEAGAAVEMHTTTTAAAVEKLDDDPSVSDVSSTSSSSSSDFYESSNSSTSTQSALHLE